MTAEEYCALIIWTIFVKLERFLFCHERNSNFFKIFGLITFFNMGSAVLQEYYVIHVQNDTYMCSMYVCINGFS